MADMLYSMDKKNINRGNIYSDLIHKMMNNEPYEPLENYRDYNCSQSKIAKEVHRQYFIDSGKYTLEQIDILEPF